jgi:HAD superfamily, subfamily IIIB (Acid phosphatase)
VIHSLFARPQRKRLLPSAVLAATAAVAAAIVTVPGAIAGGGSVPPPPTNPTSADQIQNVDQVKTSIKNYYGDTPTTTLDPYTGTKFLHQYSPTGAYANEMTGIEADATTYLDKAAKHDRFSAAPAIVLDVDDTTLNTYSYEIYTNFVYDPTSNAAFVNAGSASVFPATPGMPALVSHAAADGYTIFYLTGRPATQRTGTVANLGDAGYAAPDAAHLYMKDYPNEPWLNGCAPSCSTTAYKSLTRQHIESLGYDIAADFGDQYSDLNGGFTDQTFKIPNPMYYLP